MGFSVIIGAGPAGLTAAYELKKAGSSSVIFEQREWVGGIARTVKYKGYRFDIGGHRFFTGIDRVQEIWEELLGKDLLVRPRLSRVFFKNRYYDYPLKPVKALFGLGPLEAAKIIFSYGKAQVLPTGEERSFEDWVTNRFGRRLFEIFFKTYTEKVWGLPCSEISADWAAQRIQNLDLLKAIREALTRSGNNRAQTSTSLIEQYRYPRLGPGMMWERCRDKLAEGGVETVLGARVVRLHCRRGRIVSATVCMRDGSTQTVEGDHFISSMPIGELVNAIDPPPPRKVIDAASRLRHRDFLTVGLVVGRAHVFPDNWVYVHSPNVQMGRIQNFKNWSPDMVPNPAKTFLGLEYFVQEHDDLWSTPDTDLIELGARECEALGLVHSGEVEDGTVVRMPKAYPIYDPGYRLALRTIREYVDPIRGLQLVGRNGQHRYNNQDHSMLTAIYAARNVVGACYDVWNVNVEEEYHEHTTRGAPEAARPRGVSWRSALS